MGLRDEVGKAAEIADRIEERWKQLVGFGCGYFHKYEIRGDELWVWWERPVRQGGGIADKPDRFPVACFECDTVEQAEAILQEAASK